MNLFTSLVNLKLRLPDYLHKDFDIHVNLRVNFCVGKVTGKIIYYTNPKFNFFVEYVYQDSHV